MVSKELEHVDAVHVRHIEIENHESDGPECHLLDRLQPIGRLHEIERLHRLQRSPHHLPDGWRVVDNQNARHERLKTIRSNWRREGFTSLSTALALKS